MHKVKVSDVLYKSALQKSMKNCCTHDQARIAAVIAKLTNLKSSTMDKGFLFNEKTEAE